MRNGWRQRGVTLGIGLLVLSGCDTAPDADAGSDAPATDGQVVVQGFAFRAENITVTAGSQVTWTNEDVQAHPLQFDDGRRFSLSGGDSVTVPFDNPGVYPYRCAVHQGMTGTVTVGEASSDANAPDDARGMPGGY